MYSHVYNNLNTNRNNVHWNFDCFATSADVCGGVWGRRSAVLRFFRNFRMQPSEDDVYDEDATRVVPLGKCYDHNVRNNYLLYAVVWVLKRKPI